MKTMRKNRKTKESIEYEKKLLKEIPEQGITMHSLLRKKEKKIYVDYTRVKDELAYHLKQLVKTGKLRKISKDGLSLYFKADSENQGDMNEM